MLRVASIRRLVKKLHEQPAHTYFDGIIVTSFDQILGAIPTVTYPQGFITDEAARNTAEDAMLLLSVGKREVIFSVMSFTKISKIGVVGIRSSTVESPLAVAAVFDARATSIVWRTYPLIRSLIAREMRVVKQQPARVAARLFKEVQEICQCSGDEKGLGRLKERLSASIDNTIVMINSLLDSGQMHKLENNAAELKRILSQLVPLLGDFRFLLNEKLQRSR